MRSLKKLFRLLTNAGVYGRSNIIQRRRIRILNVFNFIGAIIILAYFTVNVVVGTMNQAFTILSGLAILTVPVYILNFKKRTNSAKLYFVLVAVVFINFLAYKTLLQFQHRDNDFIMIGFSTLIVVLFDNPQKLIIFLFNVSLAITLKVTRILMYQPESSLSDNWFSVMNLLTAFVCVYFFTGVYKADVLKSEGRIRAFAKKLERQKFLVQSERDELIYNKQLIRTTIDNLPVFITMMDAKGKFIIVNSRFEKALKLKLEEIEGKNYNEVLGNRISKLSQPLFEKCLTGVDVEIDHPIFFPSGEFINAFGKYVPIVNKTGRVTHVLSFVADIRKQKKAESKLRVINSSKDKILSILSHDLRGPLNSLSGLLDYSKDIEPDVFNKLMDNIKNQVGALNFTLDNVLNWVKTQLGGFSAQTQQVDVAKMVKNSLDLYDMRFNEKSLLINNQLKEGYLIWIDPDHLDIVIRNLLSNAIKFTPEGGEIVLNAVKTDSKVEFSIKDSGVGMSDELISQIMGGINRKKPHTNLGTNGEKGTGLGLNFCRDILKLNSATMEIRSQQGQGTEIAVQISTV